MRVELAEVKANLATYALAIISAFAITAMIISMLGKDPVVAYNFLFHEGIGTVYGFSETLLKSVPLLFCALGLSLAFTAKFWNIGAEGQLHMGAMASSWVGLALAGVNPLLTIALAVVASFLMGAIYAGVPALLKTKLRVNEVITTLLMNFVAIYFIGYLVSGPWKDPTAWELWAPTLPDYLWLPKIIPRTRIHAGLLLALACVPLTYVYLQKSTVGYKAKVIGFNPSVAKYSGISIPRNILFVALLSGGLAGLAGMSEIFGVQYRLMMGFSPGFGYTAIMVSWLGRNNPIGVLLVSIFFGFLINGGEAMQRGAGVPVAVSNSLMGLILIFVLIFDVIIRRRMKIA